MVWTLQSLAFYLKGYKHFNWWTYRNPLGQATAKEICSLTNRMQDAPKVIHNKISDTLSRSPVVGPEGIERVLNRLGGQASYAYNRIRSSMRGDMSPEVLEDPALGKMWKEAKDDKEYQAVAKVVADKVLKEVVLSMRKHPVKEYHRTTWRAWVQPREGWAWSMRL